jgi:integrase
MPLFKIRKSPYWQIRFELAGFEVRRSAGTSDRRAAQELEEELRRRIKLGEQHWAWQDAVAKCEMEDAHKRSWERTQRSLEVLNEYLSPETALTEIDYEALPKIRSLLQLRTSKGNGWKTKRLWKKSTCNRVLAVAGSILARCASDEWKNMIPRVPKITLFVLGKSEPKWITREQAHTLLGRLPPHTRDMALFALATGLPKSNVAGLEWERVDLERRCCYVPGYLTKGGEPIPVPLNEDALAVLERCDVFHAKKRGRAGRSRPRPHCASCRNSEAGPPSTCPCAIRIWTQVTLRTMPTGPCLRPTPAENPSYSRRTR